MPKDFLSKVLGEEYTGIKFLRQGKSVLGRFNERLIDIEKIAVYYRKIILRIISSKNARRKVIVAVVIFSIFSYLLVPFGFVTNEFFPKSENDYLYVNLELPSGSNTITTTINALKLLENLRKTKGVE